MVSFNYPNGIKPCLSFMYICIIYAYHQTHNYNFRWKYIKGKALIQRKFKWIKNGLLVLWCCVFFFFGLVCICDAGIRYLLLNQSIINREISNKAQQWQQKKIDENNNWAPRHNKRAKKKFNKLLLKRNKISTWNKMNVRQNTSTNSFSSLKSVQKKHHISI